MVYYLGEFAATSSKLTANNINFQFGRCFKIYYEYVSFKTITITSKREYQKLNKRVICVQYYKRTKSGFYLRESKYFTVGVKYKV